MFTFVSCPQLKEHSPCRSGQMIHRCCGEMYMYCMIDSSGHLRGGIKNSCIMEAQQGLYDMLQLLHLLSMVQGLGTWWFSVALACVRTCQRPEGNVPLCYPKVLMHFWNSCVHSMMPFLLARQKASTFHTWPGLERHTSVQVTWKIKAFSTTHRLQLANKVAYHIDQRAWPIQNGFGFCIRNKSCCGYAEAPLC